MKLIDGKAISNDIKAEIKSEIDLLTKKGVTITLAVILVGNDEASKIYIRNKKLACDYTGIKSKIFELPCTVTQVELLNLINDLNNNKEINGILVQLPLPSHIDEQTIITSISKDKDVDCFHPYNVGMLSIGNSTLLPCTPAGIIELLKRSNIEIEAKNCVVVGRSNIVGKPISSLLLKENGTVTTCHSKTINLEAICKQADILVVAIGKPKFIKAHMIKEGVTIIDVGMNRDLGKLCGDVDFEECKALCSAITPVPGGVGPMTISMLMKNCLQAYKNQHK